MDPRVTKMRPRGAKKEPRKAKKGLILILQGVFWGTLVAIG